MSTGLKAAKSISSEAIHANLKYKLAALLTSEQLDKNIDWMHVLIQASTVNVLHLHVPETLVALGEGKIVFTYTDSDGIVRTTDEPSACEQFLYMCDAKYSLVKKANPQGLLFPKFLSFREKTVESTIRKQKDLRVLLQQPFEMVQRYVVPSDFVIRKLVVRWRRTKVTKYYTVTSSVPMRSRQRSVDLANQSDTHLTKDLHYFASLHTSDSCRVTKEQRVSDAVEEAIRTVSLLIETFVLTPEEHLEEFIGSVLLGHDGHCYVLSCSRARTSLKDGSHHALAPNLYSKPALPEITELAERIAKHEGFGKMLALKMPAPTFVSAGTYLSPRLFVRDPGHQATTVSLPVSPTVPCPSSARPPTDEVTFVANTMDKLCEQAKARKEVSNFLQQIKFKNYPPGFLQKCIEKMYQSVAEEPRLSKYFSRNGQMITHIRHSMNQVFLGGRFVTKIKSIHKTLDITDVDFALYLRLFATAFESEGASKEHTKMAVDFLDSFKDLVVTRRRIIIDEDGTQENVV